jgi:fermentation-respiration switch protein FrsA (DUF1100 family)
MSLSAIPSSWRLSLVVIGLLAVTHPVAAASTETLIIRGHRQTLHLYGPHDGMPVIVSSGDGGWVHLGPSVAETLAGKGFFVVGFDVKAYLEGFTSSTGTLSIEDEPGDYRALVDYAARRTSERPILVGVSEGAGLSLLAATDPALKTVIAGVIGLGLPNVNELGWRWKDSLIYVTHAVPHEPTFSAQALAARVSPLPLAAIHSTHDEFVPVVDVQKVLDAASEPKRLWVVQASDHRFSDNPVEFNRRLLEAIDWVRSQAASRSRNQVEGRTP